MGKVFSFVATISKWTIQLACFGHLFNQEVFELSWCNGPSMLPYFEMSGIVAVEKVSRHFKDYEIGDVLISSSPHVPGRNVLKRVIGLPGDNICIDPTLPDRKYINVPEGHVWLGGDNIDNSIDSRMYGPVAMGLVKGKVFAKVWPEPGFIKNIVTSIA